MTYIRLALWGGFILALPIIAGQIWGFIAPGLYRDEKKVFITFLMASPILFLWAQRWPIILFSRWLGRFS